MHDELVVSLDPLLPQTAGVKTSFDEKYDWQSYTWTSFEGADDRSDGELCRCIRYDFDGRWIGVCSRICSLNNLVQVKADDKVIIWILIYFPWWMEQHYRLAFFLFYLKSFGWKWWFYKSFGDFLDLLLLNHQVKDLGKIVSTCYT